MQPSPRSGSVLIWLRDISEQAGGRANVAQFVPTPGDNDRPSPRHRAPAFVYQNLAPRSGRGFPERLDALVLIW